MSHESVGQTLVKFSILVASKFVNKHVYPEKDVFMTVAECSKKAQQMAKEANIVFMEAFFVEALEFSLECKCTVNGSGELGFAGFRCVADKAAYVYRGKFKMALEELKTRDGVKIRLQVITYFQNVIDRIELLPKVLDKSKKQVAKSVGYNSFEELQAYIESLVAFF